MGVVPAAGDQLRFELLGPVRALRAGRELDLGPAKQRAVLAVLLLSPGRPVATDRIVDAVWGTEPPENGANVVQKYVAGLRRVLDPERTPRTPGELLSLTAAGYRLEVRPGALDVEQFRAGVTRAAAARSAGRLAEAAAIVLEALGLWRGPALSEQTGTVFESARHRLTDEQGTAWESWAEWELELGRHAALVPHLDRLVGEFPLREGLRALLMTALYQGGRQAEALAAYQRAREFLLEEFGVEPGDRLQETQRAILRGDMAQPAPPVSPPAPSYSPAPPSYSAGPPPSYSAAPPPYSAGPAPSYSAAPPPSYSATPPSYPGGPPPSSYSAGAAPSYQAGPAPSYQAGPPPEAYVPPSQYRPPDHSTYSDQSADQHQSAYPGQSSYFAPQPGAPTAAWRLAPPPELPKRRRAPVLEAIVAVVAPVVTFALGNFIYFVYAAIRRRRWWLIAWGVGYTVVAWGFIFLAGTDPSDPNSPDSTLTEDIFYPLFFITWLGAIVHGLTIALSTDTQRSRQRDQARHFAHLQPERARHLGVGRPDLARAFDDGGLVDLNHAPGHELARLPGFDPPTAHRIVVERSQRGAFAQPEELVTRGIVTTAMLHRVAPVLICLPPADVTPPPAAWTPPSTFGVPPGGGAYHPGGTNPPPPDPSYPEPADPWSGSGA